MRTQPTLAQMREALAASVGRMTPREHFNRMVNDGIINSNGEVTRLVGGTAEPDPGTSRPSSRGSVSQQMPADATST